MLIFLSNAFFWGLIKHAAAVVIFAAVLAILLFKFFILNARVKEGANNILLLTWSFAFLFLLFELIFTFIPYSNGGKRVTHATLLWKYYYWNPVNSLLYRDTELNMKDTSKIKVFFLIDLYQFG